MEYLTSSLEKNNVTVNLKTQRSFHSLAIDSAWAAGWISYNWTKEPRIRIEREYNNTHVKLCLKYSLKPSMISCILTMRHAWIGTESFYKYMYIEYSWRHVSLCTTVLNHQSFQPAIIQHALLDSDLSAETVSRSSHVFCYFFLCVCVSSLRSPSSRRDSSRLRLSHPSYCCHG